jgi:hypothetical protein
MDFAGRSIRAGWTQICLYGGGAVLALEPFFNEHTLSDLSKAEHLFQLVRIVVGSILMTGARSWVGRKDWRGERAGKTLREGDDTPPSD